MKIIMYFSLLLCGLSMCASGMDQLNEQSIKMHLLKMACEMLNEDSSQDAQLNCASQILEFYAKVFKDYKEKHAHELRQKMGDRK